MNNEKLFMYGVGEAIAMIGDEWYYRGQTLSTSGIEISTNTLELRGGLGNALQFVGNNTSAMKATITDITYNMSIIAMQAGVDQTIGGDIWTTVEATIANKIGTLPVGAKTPIISTGGAVATVHAQINGKYVNMPMIAGGNTFTATGIPDGKLCVTYLYNEATATQIIIPANIVPAVVNLYITTPVYSSRTGVGARGSVTINIPSFKLDGTINLEMSADGAASQSLSGFALAREDIDSTCTGMGMYATITQYLKNDNVLDNAIGLAIVDGDFSLKTGENKTLQVYAIGIGGANLGLIPNASLTFASATIAKATVGANTGIVTAVSAGDSLITVKISTKLSIEASCTVTVTA